jgi:hypothetical protein
MGITNTKPKILTTREEYCSYLQEVESKGFLVDNYNNVEIEELKQIYQQTKDRLVSSTWLGILVKVGEKDLRSMI